ncbi:MAG: GNAT family N-acetyltransferase [Deltaproteobacteria bacterium]|nr:GNAT family N-acetyltransferase [Deltaproteobacteria bacterium]
MPQGLLTIRRGKRTDLPALAPLLPFFTSHDLDKKQTQHWRRLVSDPAHDFYVAEHQEALQGMVLVSYIRTLTCLGWLAILDLAVSPSASGDIYTALIAFAKGRAHKRGCQRIIVSTRSGEQQMPLTSLLETGFLRTGEVLSCPLQETP